MSIEPMNHNLECPSTLLRLSKEAIAATEQKTTSASPLRSLSRGFLYAVLTAESMDALPADGQTAVAELETRAAESLGLRSLALLELFRRDLEVIEVSRGRTSGALPLPLSEALDAAVLRFAGDATGAELDEEVGEAEEDMGLRGDFHRGSALVPALTLLGASAVIGNA